jgi:peptidoglycan hydrolase-like protein with peptidoglycan-binding domain
METLAYVHLAASSESLESTQIRCFEQFNWKELPSSAWIHLGAIAISLAVLGIASSSALALQTGNQGSQVTDLQQKLTASGFYKGQITGFYGPTTQEAVRRFQQAQGLPVDGIAGPNTLSALYATSGSRSSLPISILLRRGSRGTPVTQLQTTLKAQGFYQGPVTGYYGGLTEEAVRKFQQAKGLSIDGTAGSKTLSALGGNADTGGIQKGSQLQFGNSGSAVTQLQNRLSALGFYQGPITGFYNELTEAGVRDFQRSRRLSVNGIADPTTLAALQDNLGSHSTTILQRGSQGTAVSQLQNRLRAVGVYNGPVTGYYGELTEAAVRKFQLSRGLSVNGIAGPTTLGALQNVSPNRNRTAIA